MSILFAVLMFLFILAVTYFLTRKEVTARAEVPASSPPNHGEREYGFSIPPGYSFHPAHTWVVGEGGESTRIGIDSFAANLLGKVNQIEVVGLNRWVRQGQKFMTLKIDNVAIEILSPIEGVITSINRQAVDDPMLVTRDPYKDGWIATVKSPDFAINRKNLVQGAMVAPWMQNSVSRLNSMLADITPALAQDGGQLSSGVLSRVTVDLREKLIKEFFLN